MDEANKKAKMEVDFRMAWYVLAMFFTVNVVILPILAHYIASFPSADIEAAIIGDFDIAWFLCTLWIIGWIKRT